MSREQYDTPERYYRVSTVFRTERPMSETPKSGKFGFAATLQGTRSGRSGLHSAGKSALAAIALFALMPLLTVNAVAQTPIDITVQDIRDDLIIGDGDPYDPDDHVVDGEGGGTKRLLLNSNNDSGSITVTNGATLTFENNNMASGAVIRAVGGNSSFVFTAEDGSRIIFQNNQSVSNGGVICHHAESGIDHGGSLEFNGETIFHNNNAVASLGGAIHNSGTITFNGKTTFTDNTAGTGGAIHNAGGTINLNVSDGEMSVFAGNSDSSGSNSIHFSGTGNQFNVTTLGTGLLDMQDAMRGAAYASVAIKKEGEGTWRLAENNVFANTAAADFDVLEGTLHLSNAGSTNAALRLGSGTFTLADGATIRSEGNNAIFTSSTITLDTDSKLEYDLIGANHGDTMLILSGDTVSVNSHVYVSHLLSDLSIVDGEHIVLVEGRGDGVSIDYGTLYELNGTNWQQYTGMQYELAVMGNDLILYRRIRLPDPFMVVGTPNAKRAIVGMNDIFHFGKVDEVQNLYDTLFDIKDDPRALADAFAQLHGEVFASNKLASIQMQRQFQQLMPSGRDFVSREYLLRMCNHWGTFTGDLQNRKNIGPYSGYDLSSVGFAFGMDRTIVNNLFLGVALGYDNTYQKFDSIRSSSQSDAFRSMVYGSWFNGTYFVDAYAGYTKNRHDTKRNIDIDNTFSATARSKYGEDAASVGLEVGRQYERRNGLLLAPSVGFHYVHLGHSSITETGGGEANLYIAGSNYQSFQVPFGIKASRVFMGSYGIALIPEARISYVRELADDAAIVRTSFANVRDVTFLAKSGDRGRDMGRLGFGVSGQLPKRLNFRFDYDYEVYRHTTASTLAGSLGMSW